MPAAAHLGRARRRETIALVGAGSASALTGRARVKREGGMICGVQLREGLSSVRVYCSLLVSSNIPGLQSSLSPFRLLLRCSRPKFPVLWASCSSSSKAIEGL